MCSLYRMSFMNILRSEKYVLITMQLASELVPREFRGDGREHLLGGHHR